MDSIFIEFVEVYISSVLYLRGLYPAQIFKRRKFCNLPVWCSIYPKLNDYLREIYLAIRDLKLKSQLGQIDLLIYKGNIDNIVESHVIEVDKDFEVPEQDKYLMNIEEKFRKSLLALEKRCKSLKPIGKDCKFKIFLHTTESSYINLCSESKFQVASRFPLIKLNETITDVSIFRIFCGFKKTTRRSLRSLKTQKFYQF